MNSHHHAALGLRCGIALGLLLASGAAATADDYAHLRMGNPSQALEVASHKNNFLVKKDFFALSYNNVKGTPNWVSWRLAKENLGNAPRKPFFPDTTLPSGFKQVLPSDYSNSGFDRGHMC